MMDKQTLSQFIKSLIELTKTEKTRRLTTDPFKAGEEYEYAASVNGFVLIDGKLNSRTILEHGKTTFYVIVSGNEKVTFNNIKYSVVCVVRKTPKSTRLYGCLSDTETLALDCDSSEMPLQAVGSNNHFISNPTEYEHYYPGVGTDGTVCMLKQILDVPSKLDINVMDGMLCVAPKNNNKAPS